MNEKTSEIGASASSQLSPISAILPRTHKVYASSQRFSIKTYLADCYEYEESYGQTFIWCAVSLILGAYYTFTAQFDIPNPAVWVPMAFLLAVLCLQKNLSSKADALAKIAFAFLIGCAVANIESANKSVLIDQDVTTNVSGRILFASTDNAGIKRYVLEILNSDNPTIRRMPERVQLVDRNGSNQFDVGQTITGRARLTSPSGPVYPGGFDFAFSAFTKNIGAYGFFLGAPQKSAQNELAFSFLSSALLKINQLRAHISYRISNVLKGQSGAIASALIVSDRASIEDETSQSLRAAGLAHILAISGLHMALAAGIFFVGLRLIFSLFPTWVQSFPVKKIAALGAIATSTIYLAISGMPVSALRAWIMLVIVLMAVILNRQALTLRNVAIAAIIIVFITPSAVMTPGFQMSFAATAALIVAYSHWSDRIIVQDRNDSFLRSIFIKPMKAVIGLALTAIIAGLATGIFSVQHFNEFPAYGVLGNILAMPIVTFLVMPSALLSVLLMPYGLETLPLTLLGFSIDLVIAIAIWVERLGGLINIGMTPTLVAVFYVTGLLFFLCLRSSIRYAGLASIIAGFVCAIFINIPKPTILISEDGKLVGVNQNKVLSINRLRPSEFIIDQWKAAFALEDQKPQFSFSRSEAKSIIEGDISVAKQHLLQEVQLNSELFSCFNTHICAYNGTDLSLISIGKPEFIEFACGAFEYVVLAFRLYEMPEDCISNNTIVYDQNSLRRTGSIAIYKNQDGQFVEETAINDKTRPWTVQRYYNWRSRSYRLPSGQIVAHTPENVTPVSDTGE